MNDGTISEQSLEARWHAWILLLLVVWLVCVGCLSLTAQPLAGTQPLSAEGDLAAQMVEGISLYLDRELALVSTNRARVWAQTVASLNARIASRQDFMENDVVLDWLLQSAETNRSRLRGILGIVDQREPANMRFVGAFGANASPNPAEIARGPGYKVFAVSWHVFRNVEGEGLLLMPEGKPTADVIAIPDCDWTPEQLVGLQTGVPEEWQFARRLAGHGCRVLVPALIDRSDRFAGNPGVRSVKHSQRETLWRAGYEMGRTLAGYEIQKILAAADWLAATRRGSKEPDDVKEWLKLRSTAPRDLQSLGIVGYGEGGMLALYATALDQRIRSAAVLGYFSPRERLHEEPIYRNVWSLLRDFGDAEIARMILPRAVRIEYGKYPEIAHTDQNGGAPGRLRQPTFDQVYAESERARLGDVHATFFNAGGKEVGTWAVLGGFCGDLEATTGLPLKLAGPPEATGLLPHSAARQRRQYLQILEDTQWLMRESEYARREFWKKADFKSLASFTNSTQWYRDYFRDEIIGSLPPSSLSANPRSRFLYETNGYRGYEIMLDVHPDVFACGILLVPNGIKPGERRPVVVCQHGLEGRPRDVADPNVHNDAYHQFACKLAERGFITFAPQNPYIGGTRFRQLLRKAQPLGLTLWSFIVRQHEVITDWLASLDNVDPRRIAFYGLSYGGKTAMRVPVLVDRYCLSICSADYNEWIWKNVSARAPYSYLWTGEYDMPEFNLANAFNYAELSWLIFPRPFMVERGHDDGVAPDEWVAYEFAKTRRHYVKLGLGDRTEIEFFNGPHSINGRATFDFLHRHLNWP
jgi:dienelactone hydrolase